MGLLDAFKGEGICFEITETRRAEPKHSEPKPVVINIYVDKLLVANIPELSEKIRVMIEDKMGGKQIGKVDVNYQLIH